MRTCIAMEIIFWFFVGEAIGRRSLPGYIVPADYVEKKLAKMVKNSENRHDIAP